MLVILRTVRCIRMNFIRKQEIQMRLRRNQARLKRPEAAAAISLILSQPVTVDDFSPPERSDSLIHNYCEKRQNGILLEKRFPEADRADFEQYVAHVLSERMIERAVELTFLTSQVFGTLILPNVPDVSKLVELLLWDRDDLWIFSLSGNLLAHLEFCEDEYLDPDVMDYRQAIYIIEHEK